MATSTELIHEFIDKYGGNDNRAMMKDLKDLRTQSQMEVNRIYTKAINNAKDVIHNFM